MRQAWPGWQQKAVSFTSSGDTVRKPGQLLKLTNLFPKKSIQDSKPSLLWWGYEVSSKILLFCYCKNILTFPSKKIGGCCCVLRNESSD